MFTPTPVQLDALMSTALEQAKMCQGSHDVPVGAVIVDEAGNVLSVGRNTKEQDQDPLGHAEIVAIAQACRIRNSWRLDGCTLFVTLEPCVMCAGAILAARIPRVVFGAWDEKAGAAGSIHDLLRDRRHNHQVEVIPGIRSQECGALLTDFFRNR